MFKNLNFNLVDNINYLFASLLVAIATFLVVYSTQRMHGVAATPVALSSFLAYYIYKQLNSTEVVEFNEDEKEKRPATLWDAYKASSEKARKNLICKLIKEEEFMDLLSQKGLILNSLDDSEFDWDSDSDSDSDVNADADADAKPELEMPIVDNTPPVVDEVEMPIFEEAVESPVFTQEEAEAMAEEAEEVKKAKEEASFEDFLDEDLCQEAIPSSK